MARAWRAKWDKVVDAEGNFIDHPTLNQLAEIGRRLTVSYWMARIRLSMKKATTLEAAAPEAQSTVITVMTVISEADYLSLEGLDEAQLKALALEKVSLNLNLVHTVVQGRARLYDELKSDLAQEGVPISAERLKALLQGHLRFQAELAKVWRQEREWLGEQMTSLHYEQQSSRDAQKSSKTKT